MNLDLLKKDLRRHLEFVPFYLIGSATAFIVDITIFTLLRASLGTSYSAFISYIFGTITSFSILLMITRYKLNKKRVGLIIHFSIGLGTLIINLTIIRFCPYIEEF